MRKISFYFLLVLFVACQPIAKKEYSHYKFSVQIDPQNESLRAHITLHYLHHGSDTDTLHFYLHKNFEIEYLKVKGLDSWKIDSNDLFYLNQAKRVDLIFKEAVSSGQEVRIDLAYAGVVGVVKPWQVNRITDDWVELGNYTPWYFYSPKFKKFTFSGNVQVKGDYRITSNAQVKKGDKIYIEADKPQNDILIFASKNSKKDVLSENENIIELMHSNVSDRTARDVMSKAMLSMNTFEEWLGEPGSSKSTIVIAPRKIGGGYARTGLITLSQISDSIYWKNEAYYLRYFAHEISHLWWYKAEINTWEDWLNESFAEFSALMMVRGVFGEEEFKQRIGAKKKNFEELPAIWEIPRTHEKAYQVLYNKGCVILSMLEEELGRDAFKQMMFDVYNQDITQTEQLLVYLSKNYSKQVSVKLEEWLKI